MVSPCQQMQSCPPLFQSRLSLTSSAPSFLWLFPQGRGHWSTLSALPLTPRAPRLPVPWSPQPRAVPDFRLVCFSSLSRTNPSLHPFILSAMTGWSHPTFRLRAKIKLKLTHFIGPMGHAWTGDTRDLHSGCNVSPETPVDEQSH